MTDAVAGFGTLLQQGDGALPEVFATVAEVKDISGPGLEADTIEVTNHSSPGAWREKLISLLNGGEVSFPVNFLPGDATHDAQTGLISLYLSRAVNNFRLVWPTAAEDWVIFPAAVTGFEPSAPVDDVLGADITLEVMGEPLFGAGVP